MNEHEGPVYMKRIGLTSSPDPQKRAACESAFRRGFQHGATGAVCAMREGYSVDDVDKWATDDLYRWRYEQHKGSFKEAPGPDGRPWPYMNPDGS